MAHGPTKYPTKGVCIYCGAVGIRLTDEHIIAKSLGGQHVIDDASCDECAKITKRFEEDVAREMWGDARIAFNAPSRRKNKRPRHVYLPDPKFPHDRGKDLKVAYADYPAVMVFYQMHRAGILQGLPEDVDISGSWLLQSVFDSAKAKAFDQRFPGRLTARFRHVPESFGRLVAKIGYCQALTLLDPGEFRPICLPYILGKKRNVSFVVGGRFEIPSPNAALGYSMSTFTFGKYDRLMIVSEVRLFANAHTPIYHVVVGDVCGPDEVARLLNKLGPGTITLSPGVGGGTAFGSQEHWMPEVWPLPFWSQAAGRDGRALPQLS